MVDLEKDFDKVVELVNQHPYIFKEELGEREATLWEEYVKEKGDVEKVAETVGISVYYVRRLLRKVYFTALQHTDHFYRINE